MKSVKCGLLKKKNGKEIAAVLTSNSHTHQALWLGQTSVASKSQQLQDPDSLKNLVKISPRLAVLEQPA